MLPRLVPEIPPLDAFCDVVGVVVIVGVGIGDSWGLDDSGLNFFLPILKEVIEAQFY